MNAPRITTVHTGKQETPTVKTLTFKDPSPIVPGQFYMIWIPGVDEIPMSVSYISESIKAITFRRIGDATEALFNLRKGDAIGLRGPYGNGFALKGRRPLFIAGGTGAAMLAPAIELIQRKKRTATVILGAKTKGDLFFERRLSRAGARVLVTTDDGSKGYHGFASDLAKDLLKNASYDAMYTCGPEPMMKTLLAFSRQRVFEASLERYMKCAIGLCGQCCIGDGLRVCAVGPIFDGKTLKIIPDFGGFKRDASGRRISFSQTL